MRTLSGGQQTSYGGEVTTLARLVDITLTDSSVFHMTDFDLDLIVGGITYRSDVGIDVSAIKTVLGTSPAAATITLGLTTGAITKTQIEANLFNNAAVKIWTVDFTTLTEPLLYYCGLVAKVDYKDNYYASLDVEPILSFDHELAQDKFQLTCRVDYGSTQCGKDINVGKLSTVVSSVTNGQVFSVADLSGASDNVYNYGEIVFTSGFNNGVAVEIGQQLFTGEITLRLLTPYLLVAGDACDIYLGCDKTLTGGCTLHDNTINFRGEPYVVAPSTSSTTPSTTTPSTPSTGTDIVATVYGAWVSISGRDYIQVPPGTFSEPLNVVFPLGTGSYASPTKPGLTLWTQTAIAEFFAYCDAQGIAHSSDTHIYNAAVTYIHADGSFSTPDTPASVG